MSRRSVRSYPLRGADFKSKLMAWSEKQHVFCWLNGDGFSSRNNKKRIGLCAAASISELWPVANDMFGALDEFYNAHPDWIFGFCSYDLKSEIENVASILPDRVGFPTLHFFSPLFVFDVYENEVVLHSFLSDSESDSLIQEINLEVKSSENTSLKNIPEIKCRFTKDEYEARIQKILAHIQRGDIYEMNFCMEFYAEQTEIHPQEIFLQLSAAFPQPFGAFYKLNNKYLLCASPERFMQKEGNVIRSQPMKGTIRRSVHELEDVLLKESLRNNEKERAENVMIVDLVRNDLSRIAERNTVKVDELFGVYSFPGVHQMISTVSAEIRSKRTFSEIIKAMFPMGSMTGAPKIRAMELIEHYELNARGLFSGTVGYITPQRDFDFNVLIRSMFFNQESNYLSYQAGSAITIGSVPELEYKECLLKADSFFKILGSEQGRHA